MGKLTTQYCFLHSSESVFTCAVDGAKYKRRDVRKDRGCQREIESLEVDCPTQPHPCSWRGKLTDMEHHVSEECPKRLRECGLQCGGKYLAEELEQHMARDCNRRPVPCKQQLPMKDLQDHYVGCEQATAVCTHCKQTLESKTELSQHLQVCSEYTVSCPCSDCSFKGLMSDMNNHLATSHVFQLTQECVTTRGELAALRAENSTLRSEVSNLASQVDRLLKSSEAKDTEMRELKVYFERVASREREEIRLKGDCVETDSAANGGRGRKGRREEDDSRLRHINETLIGFQSQVTEHGNQLEDMRLRQDIMDVKTTNGVLVWKIPDVRRRYREAVERKTTSLYSPPFYTSQHGYKVCIRIYLNGDGIGKGTHISLFFFLMRSEHDNLLSWPFKQSVRFTLLNQKRPSQSISEAFMPDSKSSSFQKPERDMNVASGFPKFARQTVLQDEGFTQDNMIFVKCQVDLSGLHGV
jgi:TNF receptor-associated factor 3